jgi:hypothetical protein
VATTVAVERRREGWRVVVAREANGGVEHGEWVAK